MKMGSLMDWIRACKECAQSQEAWACKESNATAQSGAIGWYHFLRSVIPEGK